MALSSEAYPHGVCLVVAYDGTDFAGYQLQPGQRTVQGELERAFAVMTGHPTRARAAGRTDAGVHALGQTVAFDSARLIPPRGFVQGLNRVLPPDLRVQRATHCPPLYNPRYESLAKTYRYVLKLGEVEDPLQRSRAYQLPRSRALDLSCMAEAAALLVGTHDFRAFRASDDQRENATRTLYSIDLRLRYADDPSLIAIDVRGTAFMKNMVRILAGTLVEVGRGRIAVDRVPAMLGREATRDCTGHTAPAHGLTLIEVELGRGQPSPFTERA